jgi:excisionase family DNA binding protein
VAGKVRANLRVVALAPMGAGSVGWRPMADPVGTSRPGLSIHEAAVMLGVSPNTVRRWCASGRLRSERVQRPQGETIRVYVDDAATEVPKQVPPDEVPGDVPIEVPPTPRPQVPAEQARTDAMAALISASIAPVLAPLVAELAANRQTVERQANQLVNQAETIGRLSAENDALRAAQTPVAAPTAAQTPDPTLGPPQPAPAPWWHPLARWWPAALAVLLVLVGAGALLVVR